MAIPVERKGPASFSAADWLCLAATPVFAMMALLTAVFGGPMFGGSVLCMAGPGASSLGGMVPMYLLMSPFHAAPWLKLLSRQRNDTAG